MLTKQNLEIHEQIMIGTWWHVYAEGMQENGLHHVIRPGLYKFYEFVGKSTRDP